MYTSKHIWFSNKKYHGWNTRVMAKRNLKKLGISQIVKTNK